MYASIDLIESLKAEAAQPAWDWTATPTDEALAARVAELGADGMREAYVTVDKMKRRDKVSDVRAAVVEALVGDGDDQWADAKAVGGAVEKPAQLRGKAWVASPQAEVQTSLPTTAAA